MRTKFTATFCFVLVCSFCASRQSLAQSPPIVSPQEASRTSLIPNHYIPAQVFRLPRTSTGQPAIRLASMIQDNAPPQQAAPLSNRRVQQLNPTIVPHPESIRRTVMDSRQRDEPTQGTRGEYIHDGNDRGRRIVVDNEWNIHGLDTEDTIGHFDTLGGRRLVSPSNRVSIYAPRFGAIRKVADFTQSNFAVGPVSAKHRVPLQMADGKDFSSTTKQHLQLDRYVGSKRASGFIDQTRGITADKLTVLFGVRNQLEPYEDLSIIRFGRFSNAESARLDLGIQSANAWRDNLSLQVASKNASPIIVNDVYKVQQIETIETDGDNAILRVLKLASRMTGRPGDEIEFTIRFDNLSARPIGNVTIVDNLTKRLEYIPDSAESSLKASFISESNGEGSEILRWEIDAPLPAGKGGVVRFKCRIR